jgi:hypothetical protein
MRLGNHRDEGEVHFPKGHHAFIRLREKAEEFLGAYIETAGMAE